jgi:beta-glucosidase
MEIIATPIDFVGLNYYYSQWVRAGKGAGKPAAQIERLLRAHVVPPHTDEVTALGWAVHPEGLEESLLRLGAMAPSLEIAVTESGAAFEDRATADGRIDDPERTAYHAAYLDAVRRVIGRGVPVSGYFAWSLLDNFEWAEGYGAGARFGLIGVDFATQARTIKASGRWYRDLIAANGSVHSSKVEAAR